MNDESWLTGPPEPKPELCEGNPCNPTTGGKTQLENDYQAPLDGGIGLTRYYNSFARPHNQDFTGQKWRHNFNSVLLNSSTTSHSQGVHDQTSSDPGSQSITSSIYSSQSAACLSGFAEIKGTVWGGKLSGASAEYLGDNFCRISSGGGSSGDTRTIAIFIISGGNGSVFSDVQSAQILKRPDGSEYLFGSTSNGVYLGQFNPEVSLVQDDSDWVFTDTNDSRERYNLFGQLISKTALNGRVTNLFYALSSGEGGDDNLETLDKVTDSYGRSLLFSYEANNDEPRLSQINTPDGTISYGYDANGNLVSVTYPDGQNKTYQYEDTQFPHHLTGITDENSERFATWAYNAEGKVVLSEHANGAERVSLTYNADGTTSVTGILGDVRVYDFELAQGRLKVKDINGDRCATCGSGDKQNRSYDANGFTSSYTDWNGNITQTVYNTLGLETSRTEAKDTPEQRTITTQWHADYRLPTQISKPGQTTDLDYDTGRLIRRTITDTQSVAKRITTYSYYTSGSKLGLLQSMDGPRIDINDVTTYDYTANGDLSIVTNPLGQTTTLSNHDASGRPQTITDANGQITQLSYTPRGWLKSENRDGQTTVYDYDNVGQLIKLTLPDASFSEYTYDAADAAHRLTDIRDNLGNTVHYTLDAMGNRKKTETKDPSGNLTRLLEQEFNQLSQLQLNIGGEGQITHYDYDLNGN
ncbi:MAG: DUF6531 domain-containing protein, partial [Methylococcales bacterium]